MQALTTYLKTVGGFSHNAKLYLVHTVLSGLGLALLVLLYNLYILSLGFKQDMIGLVTLVACVVAVFAALPVGLLSTRLGYKFAFIFAVSGTAGSIALPLVFPTREVLIGLELIWGVAFTLLVILGAPFMTENASDAERAHLFSVQFVLSTATAFVGSLVGGELPRLFAGLFGVDTESPAAYQGALVIAVLLILSSAIPFFFVQSSKGRAGSPKIARPRLAVRNPRQVTRLLLPHFFASLGAGMFIPFANVFWRVLFGLPDSTIGTIFATSALLMAGLGLFSPTLTKRFGEVRVMVVAQTVAVAGVLFFGFSPLIVLALLGYFARDVMVNLMRPLFGHFLMEQSDPTERAAVSALSTMVFNLAWGMGSWVSGVWQTNGQFGLVFIASAAFYLLSTFLFQSFFGKLSQPHALKPVPQSVSSTAE